MPSGCSTRASPSGRASGNRNWLSRIAAGLGSASALQGASRRACAAGGGDQRKASAWACCMVMPTGSPGSARSVVLRDGVRGLGSTPARRSIWPGSRRNGARRMRSTSWAPSRPTPTPRCWAGRSPLPAGPGPGRGARHAPARGPLPPRLGRLYYQTGRAEQARAELSAAIELYHAMEMTSGSRRQRRRWPRWEVTTMFGDR